MFKGEKINFTEVDSTFIFLMKWKARLNLWITKNLLLLCTHEGPCCAPRCSEKPLQHSHHVWRQGCDARRQQGPGEDEGLLPRKLKTEKAISSTQFAAELMVLLFSMSYLSAESSQRWVERLHRKIHHRCCQCWHWRIWSCECKNKNKKNCNSFSTFTYSNSSVRLSLSLYFVPPTEGPPDGDWSSEALLKRWTTCVVCVQYWWNAHRQNTGRAQRWDDALHHRI